jgi:hypothetical protein
MRSGEIENKDGLSMYKESDHQWEAYRISLSSSLSLSLLSSISSLSSSLYIYRYIYAFTQYIYIYICIYMQISGEIENKDGLSVYKESDDQWKAYRISLLPITDVYGSGGE